MENINHNRRRFFAQLAGLGGAVLLAPAVLQLATAEAQEKRRSAAPGGAAAAGGTPLVDPKDPVAKAVKYTEDHKSAPEAKGNHCSTCGFYKKTETRNGKEAGTCTIFAGKLVYGQAWCASWNKKA